METSYCRWNRWQSGLAVEISPRGSVAVERATQALLLSPRLPRSPCGQIGRSISTQSRLGKHGSNNQNFQEIAEIVALLKTCATQKNLLKGTRVHVDILTRGLLEKNCYIASALISMYAKCGALAKAAQVIDELQVRDEVSWNALMAGYVHQGQGEKALACFEQMRNEGISPGIITFTCALKACGSIGAADKGQQIHKDIVREGFLEKDVVLGTTLVDMYAKCGALDKAARVLYKLPARDVVSWSALIARYAQLGQGKKALTCFEQMQHEGISPNVVTFLCILKACGSTGAADKGKQIHDEIVRQGLLGKDSVLGTGLVDMYAKCGALAKAAQVLDELPVRSVASWNALIAGYVQQGQGREALHCYERMQCEGPSPNLVTFTCILKACGSIGAVDKGKHIHKEIVRQGLLGKDIVLGNTLVDMYAKSGALEKAAQVLDELLVRDVVSWSALIAGYVQHGQGEEALKCFSQMQSEGLSPDSVILTCILKACGSIGAVDKVEVVHDEIVRRRLLGEDIVLGSTLVDMYVKSGNLEKAGELLDEIPVRNVCTWNALMAGYAQHNQGEQVLNYSEQMQCEGLSPNAVTFIHILKACGTIGAVDKGEQIHNEIVRKGLLEKDTLLGTTLVEMYAKCGVLAEAARVLDKLSDRNVLSWNALIMGYAQQEQFEEAMSCFERMQCEGISPNSVTFACILRTCGSLGAAEKGEQLYDEIIRRGWLGNDIVFGISLVDMYVKWGALAEATQVLGEFLVRNGISFVGYAHKGQSQELLNCFKQMQPEGLSPKAVYLTWILKACGSIGAVDKGKQIHEEIIRQGLLLKEIMVGNILVDMYAKCGALSEAAQVLHELPARDVLSWSALIAGYAQQGQGDGALNCYKQMQHEGLSPDAVTFIHLLKACGHIGAADRGKQIHDDIVRQGLLGRNIVVGNSLVDMYVKCGALVKAARVLDELPVRDVVSWSTLMTGYVQQGHGEEALKCFGWMQREGLSPDAVTFICILKACGSLGLADKGEQIHHNLVRQGLLGRNIVLGNSLVDMYAKCGALEKAARVLNELPVRDVVTWNALITGFTQEGQGLEALKCFGRMKSEGFSPDTVTFICILKACGSIGAVDMGKKIHKEIARQGLLAKDFVLRTTLVDMYAKCGALIEAAGVLEDLPVRDVISWSALIAGYAQQGKGEDALRCFKQMQIEGLSPDAVTLACVLSACSRSGLLNEGEVYFATMSTKYGMLPNFDHHVCMVDLFGRAGEFDKAVAVIKEMPCTDDLPVWLALLSACRGSGNVKLGEVAFDIALQLDERDSAAYVLMMQLLAYERVLSERETRSLKKPGISHMGACGA